MTAEHWEKELARLRRAVTRAKTKMRKQETLAAKIEAKQSVQAAEENVRQHLVNYYRLVTDINWTRTPTAEFKRYGEISA